MLWLMASTLAFTAPSGGDASSKANVDPLITRLQEAERRVNAAPREGIGELEAALRDFTHRAPEVANSPKAQEARMFGLLALARAALALEEHARGRQIMDEAIRIARGDPVPSDLFGPRLQQLHQDRVRALHSRGYGSIEVRCKTPCDVYLDERRVGTRENRLVMGTYRLWVEARDPSEGSAWRTEIELSDSGKPRVIRYPTAGRGLPFPAPLRPPPTKPAPRSASIDNRPPDRRLLPLWFESTSIVTGTVAVTAGAVMLAFDGRPKGCEPDTPRTECETLWNLAPYGATTVAAGSAALITGIVTLIIDQMRARPRKIRPGPPVSFGIPF